MENLKKIIQTLKEMKYNFDEQQEYWDNISYSLSDKDKFTIVKKLIDDIFPYLNLISEISYDIATTDEEYLDLLDEIIKKVKKDLASGSFIKDLIRIGTDKSEVGLQIFNKISELNKDDLIIYGGFILGGYGKNNKESVIEYIKTNIKNVSISGKIAFIKALLVMFEDEKKLTKESIKIIEDLHKTDNIHIKQELAYLYLFFYKSNHQYFFNKLFDLVKLNDSSINRSIFRELYRFNHIENETELINLIEYCKDDESGDVLHYIAMSLLKVDKVDKTVDIIIYWINKNLYFEINLDNVLEELGKKQKHKEYVELFLDKYRSIEKYEFFLPEIITNLGKNNLDHLVRAIKQFYEKNSNEEYVVLKCLDEIISIIYTNSETLTIAKEFFDLLKDIVNKKPFIDIDFSKIDKKLKSKEKEKQKETLNMCKKAIEKCLNIKQQYDFNLIVKNLKKYNNIEKYINEKFFRELERKEKYHPLLLLLETREKLHSKAILNNLDAILSTLLKNEKNIGKIKNSLKNANAFWNTISELILVYKLRKNKFEVKLQPKLSNGKYLDIETDLNGKKIFFEVISPDLPRDLRCGRIGYINEVAFKKIRGEYKNHLEGSKEAEDSPVFIVIDTSSSIIDEYDILNALEGSTEIITGVIYFKRELVFEDEELKVKLIGDILLHTNAKNKLSQEEFEILRNVIFN